MDDLQAYFDREGLDKLVELRKSAAATDVFDSVSGQRTQAFDPQLADLVRLHRTIRERRCFTVLEFGVGYSTVVMADALYKNRLDWDARPSRPDIRNRHLFKLFAVDASQSWIAIAAARLPAHLAEVVTIQFSEVEIGTFNGQLCHFYQRIPNVIADFIYLDAPSAKDVRGEIRGLSFECDERTVMSGDLLLMESTFLPGTMIQVDGRTNNCRFLTNNFRRRYKINWDEKQDYTSFELDEERLGKFNLLGSDFF